ncbi:MAG TPA: serine hydroxymethyltransferase, partial [Alphaproteobacteria bacterium]|nr:serine hydroxymethyltransferase [Alphaproteobacteria bacterium]
LENARVLAKTLLAQGFGVVSGGTDSHIVLLDLTAKNLTGKDSEKALERAGMTCNKNAVPFDPKPPMVTSGVRLGSPAATSRGFGQQEFKQIGEWIGQALEGLRQNPEGNPGIEQRVRGEVKALCQKFPMYS